MSSATALVADHATEFADQGFLVLRGLLDERVLQPVRDALGHHVDHVLDGLHRERLIADRAAGLPFARRLAAGGRHVNRYGRSWTGALAGPAVFALHQDPALLAALRGLLGPAVAGHRQFNIRPKLPGQDLTTVPWHQDSAYYGAATVADTIITVWAPLVAVDAGNGCMQVVPRSQREGLRAHDQEATEAAFLCLRGEPDPARVLTVPMGPGDVLLMHNLLWHRSLANASEGIRWSIDMRFYPPATANAELLRAGFPEPWMLCGAPATPVERWMSWYR